MGRAKQVVTWRTRVRRWATAVLAFVFVVALAGGPVYAHPRIDPLRHADAILILGGHGEARELAGDFSAEVGFLSMSWWSL